MNGDFECFLKAERLGFEAYMSVDSYGDGGVEESGRPSTPSFFVCLQSSEFRELLPCFWDKIDDNGNWKNIFAYADKLSHASNFSPGDCVTILTDKLT